MVRNRKSQTYLNKSDSQMQETSCLIAGPTILGTVIADNGLCVYPGSLGGSVRFRISAVLPNPAVRECASTCGDSLLRCESITSGPELKLDTENMRATNAPEVDGMIHGKYRKGWDVQNFGGPPAHSMFLAPNRVDYYIDF
jgi:hypothetical protein